LYGQFGLQNRNDTKRRVSEDMLHVASVGSGGRRHISETRLG
jgi:hypothetical protein